MRNILTQKMKAGRKRCIAVLLFFAICAVFFEPGIAKTNEALQIPVTGTVTEAATGLPLPGVSILIKGTTEGTITDQDGKFTINASETDVLVFSFMGFLNEEITVGTNTVVDVALVEDVIGLDEVIVTGYGVQKRSDLTGSIASVTSEDLVDVPYTGVDQALQGRAAGVSVTQNTGMPGGQVSIQIRGITSINGGSPLVIVDGVRSSLNNLNPGDIESIEILKDASSAAIYGSTGGNGVILVTTKKGKSNELVANFNYYRGWQKPWKKMDIMNAQEYAEIRNIITAQQAYDRMIPYEPWCGQPDTLQDYDWQDIMFRTATMESYDLSLAGGGEKSTFFISGNYQKQAGILEKSDYERFGLRINSEHELGKMLTIGENLNVIKAKNYGYEESDFQGSYLSPIPVILKMDPFVAPYDENGDWVVAPNDRENPKVEEDVLNRTRNTYNVGGNIYANLTPFKGFTFTTSLNAYTELRIRDEFEQTYHYSTTIRNGETRIDKRIDHEYGWQVQNYATYSTKIADVHNFSVMAGIESEYKKSVRTEGSRLSLFNESEEMRYFAASTDNTSSLQFVDGDGWEDALAGYFGRVNYDYRSKYLVTANFRYDRSSRFGPDYREGYFPSFSLGWKFSEEPFIKQLGIFSFGKLRYGYGETGANNIGRYGYYAQIQTNLDAFNYPFDGSSDDPAIGGALIQIPNKEIHWETVIMSNYGIDLAFLENKLTLSVDYFKKTNDGMLIYQSIPATAGFYQYSEHVASLGGDARPIANIGSTENKGIEVTVGYRNREGALKYGVDFNFSSVKSTVVDIQDDSLLNGAVGVNLSNICLTAEGSPVSQYYGLETNGLFTEADAAINQAGNVYIWNQPYRVNETTGDTTYAQAQARPGDFRFVDQNGDGVINSDDRVVIGNPVPKFIFGFSVNMEYKNFDFSMFFEGKLGHENFNGAKLDLMSQDDDGNRLVDVLDQYRDDIYDIDGNLLFAANHNTDLPRLDYQNRNRNLARVTDFYVEDASYVRLKNIQLGYTLPLNITQRVGVERLRVYVGAKNLLTFTKYSGFDPEIGASGFNYETNSGDMMTQGLDASGNYPHNKMFLVGVNLQF